jgi:GNAT superfamily N-acetyltransferase
LSLLADLNFAEWCRAITRTAGGRLLETGGVLLWCGAHPSPAIVNGAIRTSDSALSADELLDLAAQWFGEVGHGYAIHVRSGHDDDLEAAARKRGLHPFIDLPVMAREGPAPEVVLPEGYTLTQIRDAAEVVEFASVVARPFELPEEIASVFARPEAMFAPFTAGVIARDAQGRPVSGAWTHVSHGVAGVGFVGTLEQARGLGLGTAVTAAAIGRGYQMGATISALQASPMGRPVYARIGYVEVGMYRLLAAFPPGTTHQH